MGNIRVAAVVVGIGIAAGCASEPVDTTFADAEDLAASWADGKADTGFVTNLDAREVEMTVEGDVDASGAQKQRAPLDLGQFVLTSLKKHDSVYIQSLAEDDAHGTDSIEWRLGTTWKTWGTMTTTERSQARHFRLDKVNAVVLNATTRGLRPDYTLYAKVPLRPYSVFSDAGASCADAEDHISADNEYYWYLWNPGLAGCTLSTQQVVAKVTTVLPKGAIVYPEYDKLYADGIIEVGVMFGAYDSASDPGDKGYRLADQFATSLTTAGFTRDASARGERFRRTKNGITSVIDVYTPREFSGLMDTAHLSTFIDIIHQHEVIIYNGHSVLGASDFWANPALYQDNSRYQVFFYNGCLGYEYYVAPILAGKGAANADVVVNTVETPFSIMVAMSSLSTSFLLPTKPGGSGASWQAILGSMNAAARQSASISGTAFFGVSGARDNHFRPL